MAGKTAAKPSESSAGVKSPPTQLDVETDTLNQKIREFERVLAERRFGVSARIPLALAYNPPGVSTELAFCKWNDEWRLVLVDSFEREEGPPSEDRKLLLSASREERLEAANSLGSLARTLLATIEEERRRVSQALSAADEAIEFVKGMAHDE